MKNITLKNSLFTIVLSSILLAGCGGGNTETLYVYSWSDYFDPELISKFESENNCHVSITTFDSNEAMYAKLKAGGNGYDLMTPSSYLIPTLVKENLISRIEKNSLTNVLANFNHDLDGQVLDPNLEWSVPYACSYTGIMYLKDEVEDASSWKVLSDQRYSKKISLLDDVRELVGIGLMYNGFSLNSTNKDEIGKATKTVLGWKKLTRKFDSEAYKNEVANKSIWIGHGYSSDAAQVIFGEDRNDIGFSLPDEGFTIAWDEFVVPSDSPRKELAHRFIDFFYDDDNALKNMTYICSLTPNKNAIKKVPNELMEILVPKNIEKGQLLKGFSDDGVLEYYNNSYDLIKAAKD